MRGAGERVGCRGLPGCSIMRAFLPFANIGVLRAGRAQPLYLLTPAGRFALRATAHRADAPLRRAHGFAALANIGVLCAGRAQPLYLLTPSGRFGPSAQVPTGHTLPSGTRMVSLPRKYRRSVRWPRTALVFAHAFRSLWAFGPSAHRAHASLRHAHGFAPSQISAFCALAAHSPCICSRLQVALGLWPKCPQGTRFLSAHLQVALGLWPNSPPG